MTPENALLSGIVGSTAYGLAGPGSDIDTIGVFAAPTAQFHGLNKPQETIDNADNKPDFTYHEAGKFCRLALAGNPTIMELLWLPPDLYEVRTNLGYELIGIRMAFLSAKRTRDAYLGYATSQVERLERRGDGSFSADTRKRTAKHARHLYRLCQQGYQLYTTGTLTVRLRNPQAFIDFGDRVAAADVGAARDLIAGFERAFDQADTVLPDQPDKRVVEDWLLRVRAHYWKEDTDVDVRQFPQSQHRDPADDPR